MGRCVPAVGHSAVVVYPVRLLASLLEEIDLPPRQGGVVCVVVMGTSEAALRTESPLWTADGYFT
jgi:hypothetical protein